MATEHVNAWTDHLLAAPVVRNGRPVMTRDADGRQVPKRLEPATVRIRWANLRPFFSWWAAEVDGLSPFDKADSPALDEAPVPLADLDDIRAVLAVCSGRSFEDRRDTALVTFLLDTGVRLGELVSMEAEHWDRRQDLVRVDGKSGPRAVHVGTAAAEALSRYWRVRARHEFADLPAFWLGARGRLGASGVTQLLYRRCDEAGVERINPHRFRHTFSHLFRAAGGAEGDLMYLAGWKSTAMAHRYGKSAAAERAREAHRRVAPGDLL